MAVMLTVVGLPERLMCLGYNPATSHHNHVDIDCINMAYSGLHRSKPSQLCPRLSWAKEDKSERIRIRNSFSTADVPGEDATGHDGTTPTLTLTASDMALMFVRR